MSGDNKLTVDGVEYPIPDKLTIGELADIEEITGQTYDPKKPGVRMMLAIAFIAMRRKNPQLTIEDVRDLDMDALVFPDEEVVESPPGETPPQVEETPVISGPQP